MPVIAATLRSLLLLGAIVLISTRVVPRLLAAVAALNSRELFLLSTTAVALGIGYATWWFGLSLAIGAFVAGLVVNESEYAHQALSDVSPLRDLFGMLFFVSVGMLLDPALVWQQFGALAVAIVSVTVGKTAILAGVVRAFGYGRVVPLAVGLTLFQVGEFAFVLARVGLASGAISNEIYALALNTAVATMAITPLVSGLTSPIYRRVSARSASEPPQAINMPASAMADHVVVCGAGRVGRTIADALASMQLPCVLIELDDARVQQARDRRAAGDLRRRHAAGRAGGRRDRARASDPGDHSRVRRRARHRRDGCGSMPADLPIVARADGSDAVHALYALGIQEVTSPEFEAAIEMTRQALLHLNVPSHDILQVASAIRRDRYQLTDGQAPSGIAPSVRDLMRQLDFAWMSVPPESAIAGRTLGELQVRTTIGASIVGVIHDGALSPNPDSGARLTAGDLVAVLGTRDQIGRFEEAVRPIAAGPNIGA